MKSISLSGTKYNIQILYTVKNNNTIKQKESPSVKNITGARTEQTIWETSQNVFELDGSSGSNQFNINPKTGL